MSCCQAWSCCKDPSLLRLKRDLLAIGDAGSGLGAKMGFCLVLVQYVIP